MKVALIRCLQEREQLVGEGISLICIPNDEGKVCLKSLLRHLASIEVNEVLVEGGEGLNGALMALQLIDELIIYYAPKFIGSHGKGMFGFPALTSMGGVVELEISEVRQFGQDVRILARVTL